MVTRMKSYNRQPFSLVLVALALALLHHGCDGARLGADSRSRSDDVEKEVKRYIRDSRKSIVEGNDHPLNHRETLSCGSDERVLTFGFTTDNYGYETSFEWRTLEGVFASGPARGEKFADNASYSYKYCVKIGEQYKLKIEDSSGDGFCCKYGNGSYRYGIDGENMYNSRDMQSFTDVGVHTFLVESRPRKQSLSDSVSWFIPRDDSSSFEANMSARDNEWLTAHNIRRKRYHEEFGKTYVPLKWSPKLAEQAKAYAVEILSDCNYDGIAHEQNVGEGENLAKNEGEGNWGDLYPADSILTRWVEREIGLGSPGNAHMTQVLWRASNYVGCGESVKPHGQGYCRIQVCRYARPGNCDMKSYDASIGNNWMIPMLKDTSKCGPLCAPEGCF